MLSKINFRKGSASYELAFTVVLLFFLLLVIIGIFIKRYTVQNLNLLTDELAREVVICDSKDDAEAFVNDNIHYFNDMSYVENTEIYIDYLPGGKTDWKKGTFIAISVSADLDSITTLKNTRYYTRVIKMIEAK